MLKYKIYDYPTAEISNSIASDVIANVINNLCIKIEINHIYSIWFSVGYNYYISTI